MVRAAEKAARVRQRLCRQCRLDRRGRRIGSSIAYAASKGAVNDDPVACPRAGAGSTDHTICPGFVGTKWQRDGQGGTTTMSSRWRRARRSSMHRG